MTSFLCTIGLHSGNWRWAGAGNDCKQVKHCQRYPCDHIGERDEHDYKATRDGRVIYVGDANCEAKGECTRCGDIGGSLGVVHRWGPFSETWEVGDQVMARRYCHHCAAHEDRVSVAIY